MQQFPIAQEDTPAVFAQLTDDEKQGVYYDSIPGALFAPDDKAAAVQAAINNLPVGQKSVLKSYAAASRYARETEVQTFDLTTVTVTIDTTITSQSKMSSAAQQAQLNPTFTAEWKQADDTFVTLDATQILRMNELVTNMVAACYKTEKDCVDGIDAGTITTTAEIDEMFEY